MRVIPNKKLDSINYVLLNFLPITTQFHLIGV
jgi:hypothetical protein